MGFTHIVKIVLLAQIISNATAYNGCYNQGGWCQGATWGCAGERVTGTLLCAGWRSVCCFPAEPRTPCACNINKGVGCTLGQATIQNHACRCELTGPLTSITTECRGWVVSCDDPASKACRQPTRDYASCRQGVFGEQGNCLGYADDTTVESQFINLPAARPVPTPHGDYDSDFSDIDSLSAPVVLPVPVNYGKYEGSFSGIDSPYASVARPVPNPYRNYESGFSAIQPPSVPPHLADLFKISYQQRAAGKTF